MHQQYLIRVLVNVKSSPEHFTNQMISVKSAMNSESFNGFGRDHQIDGRFPTDILLFIFEIKNDRLFFI